MCRILEWLKYYLCIHCRLAQGYVQENCFGLLVKNCYLLAPKTAGNNTVVVVRGYKKIITNQLTIAKLGETK